MPGRRLSEREIADVRARRAEGIGEGVIAESFGISRATVSRYTAGDSRIVHRPRPTTSELLFARVPAPQPVDPAEAPPDDRRARNEAIRAANDSPVVLAERFGLSAAQISRIRSGVSRPMTRRQEAEQVRAGAWRAECMDDEEWARWVETNPIAGFQDATIAPRPCTDCPLGFAAEMRAEGRCNGSPGWQPPADEEEEATMGEQITPDALGPRRRLVLRPPEGRSACPRPRRRSRPSPGPRHRAPRGGRAVVAIDQLVQPLPDRWPRAAEPGREARRIGRARRPARRRGLYEETADGYSSTTSSSSTTRARPSCEASRRGEASGRLAREEAPNASRRDRQRDAERG
jgi:hypothetical protein